MYKKVNCSLELQSSIDCNIRMVSLSWQKQCVTISLLVRDETQFSFLKTVLFGLRFFI